MRGVCGDRGGTALLRWGSGGEEPCDERAEVLDGFCGPEVLRGHDGVVEGMVFRP